MNIYTKDEAKIRYTLRPIPPKTHKNNAGCARGEATGNTQNRAQRSHTAPMEMIAKNGEHRKFHDLEKREMKAKWGDFGVKKQPLLHFNRASIALQFSLD